MSQNTWWFPGLLALLMVVAGCGETPGKPSEHVGVSIKIEAAEGSGSKISAWHHAPGRATVLNAQVKLTLKLEDGKSEEIERYWATWADDEVKVVEVNARNIEKVELRGDANNGATRYTIYGLGLKQVTEKR